FAIVFLIFSIGGFGLIGTQGIGIGIIKIRNSFRTLESLGKDVGIGGKGATMYLSSIFLYIMGTILYLVVDISALQSRGPVILFIANIIIFMANIFAFFGIIYLGSGFYKVGSTYNENITKIGGILSAIPGLNFIGYILAYKGLRNIENIFQSPQPRPTNPQPPPPQPRPTNPQPPPPQPRPTNPQPQAPQARPRTYNIPDDWVKAELYGYNVKRVIGNGGTSHVLLGEKYNTNYALKIYKVDITTQKSQTVTALLSSSVTDILRESAKLQEISGNSKNIVKLYGVFIDVNSLRKAVRGDKKSYFTSPPTIVMEYMGGGSLNQLLNPNMVYSHYGRDIWKDIVILVSLKVAYATEAIHKEGYVHLDIKPQNIFFTDELGRDLEALEELKSGTVEVKLGDLGSARAKGRSIIEFTPEYCGVDQVEAMILGRGADPKMDIFALGSTIYKMLELKTFNSPQLVELMDKAVSSINGGHITSAMNYLNKAKSFYTSYYQSFTMSDKAFEQIVKEMVNPDPNQRSDINTVISRLEQLANSHNLLGGNPP
ncbi:DUF973 family protein, partial [Acidianus sp. RZ1]|uniref:DUF973 family protein n=1 Tax=Acidianus sp. RZ1 TaxID=1540082 RepID=UPI0014926716